MQIIGVNNVADYRRFTVRLQLKTLLPCILLLTPVIEVITIEITGKSLATVLRTVISILIDYLYFRGQIL